MAEAENKAIFRRFYEGAWNAGDLAVVDELLAEDFVNHEVTGATQPHRELYKQAVIETRVALPDFTVTIEDSIAEGDRVVARWRSHGTHSGPGMPRPPTGKGHQNQRHHHRARGEWQDHRLLEAGQFVRGLASAG